MIQNLKEYEDYLFTKQIQYATVGNRLMCKYYMACRNECLQLIQLFNEMKLSPNDWQRIYELSKEYEHIRGLK